MIETRVSHINLYKTFEEEEGLDVGWLLTRILTDQPTDKMKAGTAFHKAVELAEDYEHYVLSAMGYRFNLNCDAEIALPHLREATFSREYDGLLVRGTVDAIGGRVVSDLKTTEQFDAERYVDGLQWRFYLDMTGADRFDWHVFQISEGNPSLDERVYDVWAYHKLTQYRYDGLHEDCLKWARAYRSFAERFLPVPAV